MNTETRTAIIEKEFTYDQESLNEALEIMEKTVFKTKKIAMVISYYLIFAIPFTIIGIINNSFACILGGAFFAVISILLLGSFKKEYINSNSVEHEQEFWSLDRKISFYDDCVNIYAKYVPEEIDFKEDEESKKYYEEMNEEMSNINYRLDKCRVYESQNAFVIYKSRDVNQPVLKKYFTEDEIIQLHLLFSKSCGKKYIVI